MRSSDRPAKVGDYVKLQRGSTYKGDLVGQPGPPLLGLGSIEAGGGFRIDKFNTFGGECPEKWMVRPGSIYVALKGATKDGSMVGSVARLPTHLPAGRLTQDTARLDFFDCRPETASYLYWILRTPQYRSYCEGRVTGSASASFSREDFLEYPVPPTTDFAMAIVETLESIESKIEQNRWTGRALEALARATFKAWFVDFEPVKAKAAGQTSFPGMPAATFAMLPDRLLDSPSGAVPAGWAVRPLSKVADFLNGLALQKYPPVGDEGDLPVIKIAELRKGSVEGAALANAGVPRTYVVNDGDLLFSWSGTLEAELWFGGRGALNQHLFKVTSDTYPRWLCLNWVRQHLPEFRLIASSKATTMGHIKRGHLDTALVAAPDKASLQAADDVIGPLYDLLASLALENRKLVTLREYLLPRLLSGRVRVKATQVE